MSYHLVATITLCSEPMKPPSTSQIHLWSVDAALPTEQLQTGLSAAENTHYARIRAPRVKQQYLQTRWAIRHALTCYFPDVAPEKWQFAHNAYGRPALCAPSIVSPIDFNISHSREALVMAFVAQGAVGVDVEYTQRQCRALAVAQRYFSVSEVTELRALEPALQRARFFELWTLKEAYIKACGMGLAIPLGSFSFSFDAREIAIGFDERRDDQPERWQFWRLALRENHQLALAFGRNVVTEKMAIQGVRLKADGQLAPLELNGLDGHGSR